MAEISNVSAPAPAAPPTQAAAPAAAPAEAPKPAGEAPDAVLARLVATERQQQAKYAAREKELAAKEQHWKAREPEYEGLKSKAQKAAEYEAIFASAKSDPKKLLETAGLSTQDIARWTLAGEQMTPDQRIELLKSEFGGTIKQLQEQNEARWRAAEEAKQTEAKTHAERQTKETRDIIERHKAKTLAELRGDAKWDDEKGFGEKLPKFPLTLLSGRENVVYDEFEKAAGASETLPDVNAIAEQQEKGILDFVSKTSRVPQAREAFVDELLKSPSGKEWLMTKLGVAPKPFTRASVAPLTATRPATNETQAGESREARIRRIADAAASRIAADKK